MSVMIHKSLGCKGYYHEGNGRCYTNANDGCPVRKKWDFGNGKKDPTCICEPGFSVSPDDNTTCYQWFTKGFCEEEGKILTNDSSEPCQDNTCGEGESPHMSVAMWDKLI